MESMYTQDKIFEKVNMLEAGLPVGEYDSCRFVGCQFADADISYRTFSECTFDHCNFSLTRLNQTTFRDVQFNNCELLGLHFNTCNSFIFTVGFDRCLIRLSSFHQLKLRKTVFQTCEIHQTDFSNADLTGAVFDQCNLDKTTFEDTILEKADFRTAYNYAIDPERNRLKKARFALPAVVGLLAKYDIQIG